MLKQLFYFRTKRDATKDIACRFVSMSAAYISESLVFAMTYRGIVHQLRPVVVSRFRTYQAAAHTSSATQRQQPKTMDCIHNNMNSSR